MILSESMRALPRRHERNVNIVQHCYLLSSYATQLRLLLTPILSCKGQRITQYLGPDLCIAITLGIHD